MNFINRNNDSDLNLISDWLKKFRFESVGPISTKEATELAVKKVREGAVYLWEKDMPVSMAGWTRPTQNGVTIAFVYTP